MDNTMRVSTDPLSTVCLGTAGFTKPDGAVLALAVVCGREERRWLNRLLAMQRIGRTSQRGRAVPVNAAAATARARAARATPTTAKRRLTAISPRGWPRVPAIRNVHVRGVRLKVPNRPCNENDQPLRPRPSAPRLPPLLLRTLRPLPPVVRRLALCLASASFGTVYRTSKRPSPLRRSSPPLPLFLLPCLPRRAAPSLRRPCPPASVLSPASSPASVFHPSSSVASDRVTRPASAPFILILLAPVPSSPRALALCASSSPPPGSVGAPGAYMYAYRG